MDIREAIQGMETSIQYLPIPVGMVKVVKETMKECEISILEEFKLNEALTVFKIEIPGIFKLFQLGALSHINIQFEKDKQKVIDDIFKDRNLLS